MSNTESFIKFDQNSNNKTKFPHKLLSTDTQVLRFHKAFANISSANIIKNSVI